MASNGSLDALLNTVAGPLGLANSTKQGHTNGSNTVNHTAALAAASQYIVNESRQNNHSSDVTAKPSSEEAAAHTLNRLLVTAIIVPLVHNPVRDPSSSSASLGLKEALESLARTTSACPKFLEHLFEASEDASADAQASLHNATFDLWATPRLLSASASLLAAAQHLSTQDNREQMLSRSTDILASSSQILNTSVDSTNQVDNVRLILLESLRTSILALSYTGQTAFSPHVHLLDALVPKHGLRDTTSGVGPTAATFFSSLPALSPFRPSSRKDRPKPNGRIPAAFSSEQSSCCFDFPLQITGESRNTVAERANALLSVGCDLCIRLAAEHPAELLDIAELAAGLLAENLVHSSTLQKQQTCLAEQLPSLRISQLHTFAAHAHYLARHHQPRLLQAVQVGVDQFSAILDEPGDGTYTSRDTIIEVLTAVHRLFRSCNISFSLEDRHSLSTALVPHFSQYVRELELHVKADGACEEVHLGKVRCAISALCLGIQPGSYLSAIGLSTKLWAQFSDIVHRYTSIGPAEGTGSSMLTYPANGSDLAEFRLLQTFFELPDHSSSTSVRPLKRLRRNLISLNIDLVPDEQSEAAVPDHEHMHSVYQQLRNQVNTRQLDTIDRKMSQDAVDRELGLREQSYILCHQNLITEGSDKIGVLKSMSCQCDDNGKDQVHQCDWQSGPERATLKNFLHDFGKAASKRQALEPHLLDMFVRLVKHSPIHKPLPTGKDSISFGVVKLGLKAKPRRGRLLANELALALQNRFVEQRKLTGEAEGAKRLLHLPRIYTSVLDNPKYAKCHETAMLGLARLSTMPTESCQEICLLALVMQIGSASPFLKSTAYTLIVQLASEQKCTTFQLLRPHLKTISNTVVERFVATPDLLTGFLSLIKMNMAGFFNATIEYTLPHLFLLLCTGHYETADKTICLIAQALRSDIRRLCLDNIAPIFRSLFLHSAELRAEGVRELIALLAIERADLKVLLRIHQSDVVGYLVVQLGNTATRKAAYDGLDFFVETLTESDQRTKGSSNMTTKSQFLEKEILPVLAYINHDLAGDHGRRTDADKSNAIRSIGALVPIIGPPIIAVTPQIMAILHSNLQVEPLMLAVLESWKEFIRTFRFEDIAPIVGQTAAALLSVWDRFNAEQTQVAIYILDYLILQNASYLKDAKSLKDHVDDIPSLDRLQHKIPLICKALRDLREKWSKDKLFANILDRTAHENVSISHESLKELQTFLMDERAYIESLTSGDSFGPLIGQCVRALMQVVAKGDSQQQDIRDIAYRCFGLIGAIDPDRIEHANEEPLKIVLNNFEDQDEAIEFALHLIQDLLVPAFRAADDTTHQSRLAYAIQELLKISGFTSAMLASNSHSRLISIKARQRLNGMEREVINTITPLLDSKYMVQVGTITLRDTPIYRNTQSYRDWLQGWANLLINKTMERQEAQRTALSVNKAAESAATIFGVFRIAIRDHDIGIARHLLPHLVLHSIISGDDIDRLNIIEEVQTILTDQVKSETGFDEERRLLTAQTLFTVMDHIGVWMRRKRQDLSKSSRRPRNSLGGEDALAVVETTMRSISQELMAQASLKCKTYSRALLNFENRVRTMRTQRKSDKDLQPYYENLHRIYAQLDEPDGMEGISTRVISPTLEHQIREHESTGRWTSAQSCWEVELQQRPDDPDLHLGLLRCLRNLGHYDTMRTHIRGALSLHPEWEALLDSFRVEGACIMGDWVEVRDRTRRAGAKSAEHSIGRALLAMRGSDDDAFQAVLSEARHDMGKSLIAAGKTSYPSIYDAVLNLHMLHEIEMIRSDAAGKHGRSTRASVNDLNRSLTARLNATLPSFRTQEPLLSLRRTAFSAMPSRAMTNQEVGEAWIATAKIARRAGHTQTAYSATLQATQHQATFAFVQRVKLLAREEQTHAAIQDLSNSINTLKSTFKATKSTNEPLIELQTIGPAGKPQTINRTSYAKACLLRARLLDSTFRYTPAEILDKYKDATREQTHSEKSWYYYGHFQDSHDGLLPNSVMQRHNVCRAFLKSAALGTKYFYRTLPRVVTIWMDIATDEQIMGAKKGAGNDSALAQKLDAFALINSLIHKSTVTIKPFQWLAVFPQLVARLVQKNEAAWVILQEIVLQVLSAYPQQAMWAMVAGSNSKDSERRRRYGEVVSKVNSKGGTNQKDVVKVIYASQRLARELLRLCDYEVLKSESTLSMSKQFPGLLEIAKSSGLLLPLQTSMTVLLPANHLISDHHRPFPMNLPLIHSFDDTIEVMNSLQKPRKVMVVGSDNVRYPFLVKPKDDLRKDARLMEFDSMINKLLQSQPEARKRKLYVRTYAVLILNEEHGLIEWVPNTVSFRHILTKLYAAKDMSIYSSEVRQLMEEARHALDTKSVDMVFREKVLTKFPPVFYEWFLALFPDPTAWLKARSAYARTAAVMSMVGFVLGLGDRHGENILFDSSSGDTVHVDLNCLFDRGQRFEIPERVPFRLTQNMVDAMGVTGYDGAFRKSAEITMSILRDNKESLMSVLEAMVHDPLGEWGAPDDRHRARNSSARQDPRVAEARKALDPVANKLDGRIYRPGERDPTPPYATSNLVDALIKEATSSFNLGKMYVGWSSWL